MVKKIFVVDDDVSILDALALTLEDAGYTVKTALKGDDTLQQVKTFLPDIILLDVLMSGSDGRHICKKLKTDSRVDKIPVIMLSAHPSAKQSSVECGADDFIAKPFERATLLTHIEKFIKR
ncbi:MAG TPA: response regulator [Candidatus Acidoferrales bacterium]|nr:response regulator [Candidatus Acidoferrales bacterium]